MSDLCSNAYVTFRNRELRRRQNVRILLTALWGFGTLLLLSLMAVGGVI